jgi:Methyltransferase domain
MSDPFYLQSAAAIHAPAPNFNRLARLYHLLEFLTFGPSLQRCRCDLIADLAGCRCALVLGDGDGRFTFELLRSNANIEIDVVDSSAAMLRELHRRAAPYAARLRSYCTDARDWQPASPPYDLVASHFFLDCLDSAEIRALASKLLGAVSPNAVWIVSDFAVPHGWFGRFIARPVISFLYHAFGILTGLTLRKLPNHAAALGAAGFDLKQRRTWLHGLLASEIWSVSIDRCSKSECYKSVKIEW